MNLIGSMVAHKVFGIGSITDFDGTYFNVKFDDRVIMFSYPDAFESFLSFCNEKEPTEVAEDVRRHKVEQKERKDKIIRKRKKEADTRKRLLAEARKPRRGRRRVRKARKKKVEAELN